MLHFRNKTLLLLLALMVLFLTDVITGSVSYSLQEIGRTVVYPKAAPQALYWILWEYRLPKALTAMLAGSALAVSGLLLQSLFRNPLAGPFVLGISSGASLGVAILILAGWSIGSFMGSVSTLLAAWLGSALVLFFLISLSWRLRETTSLLVVGLMFASFTGAIVGILQYFASPQKLQSYLIWSFGSLGSVPLQAIPFFSSVVIIGLLVSLGFANKLNGLMLGDQYANNLGIDVRKTRLAIVAITSLMTGIATGYCGPIVFVGLAVPHAIRMLIKSTDHRRLIPAVALAGGCFLLACDLLSQLPGSVQILPINAITSLLGAPFVVWIIIRFQKQYKVL